MGTILPKTKRNKQMNPGKRKLLKLELQKIIFERSQGGYTRHHTNSPLLRNGLKKGQWSRVQKTHDFKLLRETQSQKLQDQFQVFQNLYHDLEQELHTYHKNWGELPRLQKVG